MLDAVDIRTRLIYSSALFERQQRKFKAERFKTISAKQFFVTPFFFLLIEVKKKNSFCRIIIDHENSERYTFFFGGFRNQREREVEREGGGVSRKGREMERRERGRGRQRERERGENLSDLNSPIISLKQSIMISLLFILPSSRDKCCPLTGSLMHSQRRYTQL